MNIELLTKNYEYLFKFYQSGKFETKIDTAEFVFFKDSYKQALRHEEFPTLKLAALDLCGLVEDCNNRVNDHRLVDRFKDKTIDETREMIAELIVKSKVLVYEILDYFIAVDDDLSDSFIKLSDEISKDFPGYFTRHFKFVEDDVRAKEIKKYLLLGGLCGVQEYYRRHNEESYRKGIEQGKNIYEYILKEYSELNAGLGLKGFSHYTSGRLNTALGDHKQAAIDFQLSARAYSEKTKRREESELSNLATLRRCALVSSFGNAYLSLIKGQVSESINLSALARSALNQNCGKVYAAITETNYLMARRAIGSSSKENLIEVFEGLLRCREIFDRYVKGELYFYRTSLQLGIACKYMARIFPEKRNEYYKKGITYLNEAIDYSKNPDFNRLYRNQTLLAESYIIISQLYLSDELNFEMAEKTAKEAIKVSTGLDQFICESYLQLGEVYLVKAKNTAPKEQRNKVLDEARANIITGLDTDKSISPRIRGTGYILMAELNLLTPATMPEAKFYYERWLKIKHSVEHAYLQKRGEAIKLDIDRKDKHYLVIDPYESYKVSYWNEKLPEYLNRYSMIELTNEILRDRSIAQIRNIINRDKIGRKVIVDFLMRASNDPYEHSQAYEKSKTLYPLLKQYLHKGFD